MQLVKINQKLLAKKGGLNIPRQSQTIQTKQDILKSRKKFYQPLGWEYRKINQQPDAILEENMGIVKAQKKGWIDK